MSDDNSKAESAPETRSTDPKDPGSVTRILRHIDSTLGDEETGKLSSDDYSRILRKPLERCVHAIFTTTPIRVLKPTSYLVLVHLRWSF